MKFNAEQCIFCRGTCVEIAHTEESYHCIMTHMIECFCRDCQATYTVGPLGRVFRVYNVGEELNECTFDEITDPKAYCSVLNELLAL